MSAHVNDQSGTAVRVIRRYANRKLYDTKQRAFTTMAEVEDLVRGGVEVRVVEHSTGDDVTEVVLARALGSFVRASGAGVKSVLGSLLRAPGEIAKVGAESLRDDGPLVQRPHRPPGGTQSEDTATDDREKARPEETSEIGQLRDQVANLTALVERLLDERKGQTGGGNG